MQFDPVLPVIGLVLMIFLVTKLRESLLSQAMFDRSLTRSSVGERLAHGAQIALGTLLAIIACAAFWSNRPHSGAPEVNSTEQHVEALNEQYLKTSARWLSDP